MNVSIHIVLSSENKDEFECIINKNHFLKKAIKENKIKCFFIKNLKDYFDFLNLKNIFYKNRSSKVFFIKFKKTF